ncbi:farnesoic acid carboxyl-O-methyltransferase-like [Pecten maximus]|uniref:farnesoic acid carboxyl-O-methyltransferase-like n=1 Tax=Pecten maximus TaxID=6579 RepID=UPI001458B94B|nr:farnesoic acid carboxyl-O-methyltransferase-like [Pecten maximus]
MSSYFPTMKMKSRSNDEADDMYNVHGHVVNISRMTVLESLRRIIKAKSANQRDSLGIADFGTSDGRASFSLVKEMISIIHTEMGMGQDVLVYYNDQPMNDFNLLSKVIQGEEYGSGLTYTSTVYPVIIPRTMYGQCLPDHSLDLSISAVATHYLSKKVCQIQNGVFMVEADDSEQTLIREQGKIDWRNFVISRGRELKPGGFLITMNLSSDDNGSQPMNVHKGVPLLGSLVGDMVKEGKIAQEEYLATNQHIHYQRTAADFKEPFSSALPQIGELGLELVSVKSFKYYLKHPTFDIVNKDETEKLEYSKAIVAAIYPWMYHTLYQGLSVSRAEEKKEKIIDDYFSRLQKYAFEHSDHKPYVFYTEVVIHKRM